MNTFTKTILTLASTCLIFSGCADMDIPPKNIIVENQIFKNEAGITAYMAKIYSELPMLDRHYSLKFGFNNGWVTENLSTTTGEAIGRDHKHEQISGYWNYNIIRDINILIERLPEYAEFHSESDIRHWLGEAHFLRAYVFTAMAKRYGGIPIITKVLNYPNDDPENFKIARSSEEGTWLQIESDFQYAIDNCNETSVKGRANKYTAAAYKSSAMIFAASIANFNNITHYDTERNLRLCGIDKDKAAYFYKSAWNAAKIVEGHYSLYMGDWVEGNKEAQYLNFHNILQKPDNCENMLIKEYKYPELTHSWDALYGPLQLKQQGLSSGICPTLELVELYEGIPKDAEGKFSPMNDDGTYIMYDDIFSPWENAEPRLRATVILPCDEYKGEKIEIWRGVYTKDLPEGGLQKFTGRDVYDKYTNINKKIGNALLMSDKDINQKVYTKLDSTTMTAAGKSGTFNLNEQCSLTGFFLRKNMDSSLPKERVIKAGSESDWVDMRYAEVLLNRAEAAFELNALGESSLEGENLPDDAVECLNQIRKRAGCKTMFNAATLTRNDVRDEFTRELCFEHKCYWNLIRWRKMHIIHSSNTRYHAAMPFYAGKADKWFYDVKYAENKKNSFSFNPIHYYHEIPSSEIDKNTNLIQNII